MFGYNKIVIVMVILLFFLMVYITKDYREGALFGSNRQIYNFPATAGYYIKLKGATDGVDYTNRIGKIMSNKDAGLDVTFANITSASKYENNKTIQIANTPGTTYTAPTPTNGYKQFRDEITESKLDKEKYVKLINVPTGQIGNIKAIDKIDVGNSQTLERTVTVKDYTLVKIVGDPIYLSGYNDDKGITDIFQVQCYVELDNNNWSTSTFSSNKYITFYVYYHQIVGGLSYDTGSSEALQYEYISERWGSNNKVVASLSSANEEYTDKVETLLTDLQTTVEDAKAAAALFPGDSTAQASAVEATAASSGETITVKVNTTKSNNKLSNYTNTATGSPITDFTVKINSTKAIKDLKEKIHDNLLTQGVTLPVDVQILSPDITGTANVYDNETLLSQNGLTPENINEVYLGIESNYSLTSLPCPNGCNKGQLNYIDEQCYDYIYTNATGDESYQYKYCRPKCVQDECSTTGCATAEDCNGCDIYRVKERTDVNRVENVGLFYSRDTWVKNTEDGTKMAGKLMYNFVNNVWSTICNKIDPPEEEPCKCCDPLSTNNLECGEKLVNSPAIGASKLFDNIQEDVSNPNQISLENKPVNAFADVQTTEDMNMNNVVPYEAIWDVDVLNN